MSVLQKPIITEKTVAYTEKGLPKYAFRVELSATKEEIKRDVEKYYEVEVDAVSTMIVRGKARVRYSKKGFTKGKSSNFKKAIITLKKGSEIDFYKHI
jgi:large subunit ribosomal protein L23